MKVLKFIIPIFWLIVMLLLLKKEGILFSSANLSYYDILGKKDPYREEYLGIYIKDKKIGFSESYIDAWTFENNKVGFRISNTTRIFVSCFDKPSSINITGDLYINDKYELHSFSGRISSEAYNIEAKAEAKGENIEVSIYSGERMINKTILKRKDFLFFGGEVLPLSMLPSLKEGARYTIDCFGILGVEKMFFKVGKKTTIMHNDEMFDVYPVELLCQSIKANVYITPEGKILRAEFPYGWVAVAEDKKKLKEFVPQFPDILTLSSVQSNVVIKEPRKVSYLKVRLNEKTIEIKRETIPNITQTLPISENNEWLKESLFVQSRDKEIEEKAKEIIKGEKDSLKASKLIMEWIYENIRKKPSFSIPSAIEVLKNMSGDCNEHSVLFTALARSIGIPTKIVVGLAYQNGRFHYHSWCKVFIGEWVSIDPTFNQFPPDATHISLIEGDLDKSFLGYLGDVKIEVLEYE